MATEILSQPYGGPEGPCPLPISLFLITNDDFSYYQLQIWIFLITNFEFSLFGLPICIFLFTKLSLFQFEDFLLQFEVYYSGEDSNTMGYALIN